MFFLKRPLLLLPLALLLVVSTGCRVEKEQAGEKPDVDVNVDPGKLPEYKVEGPEVDVGTQEKTITVPDVEVTQEEKTITAPDVDIKPPTDEDSPEN
ncbi:MAG: hypothetical protein RIG63_21325 [Coleofasciculus chthonoplastes F3-SA18-01]|jgi:hypothetical protein|uniref:hypothetical protein n=1 Tax=Coleofasciculus chthonoplastes TaxID=64178 RepID=UPI0032FD85D5